MRFNKKKIILPIIIGVVLIIIIAASVTIVPAGSSGVVLTFGKVNDRVMKEGLNFKVPCVQQTVIISNKIQKQEVEAPAVSKDLQTVRSTIAVNYRALSDYSASIYKNIGEEYESIILLPAVQESMKSVTAKYTAEELISLRAQVGEEVKETLVGKVSEYGISIEKFNIVNFDFSTEFNEAIEAKQVAEQNLIKTKTEQEQVIVVANAEAEATLTRALRVDHTRGNRISESTEMGRQTAHGHRYGFVYGRVRSDGRIRRLIPGVLNEKDGNKRTV